MSYVAFTTVDFVILGIVLFSILIGLIRGFIRESMALVFFVLAIYLSGLYYPRVIDFGLQSVSSNRSLQVVLAYILLFFGVLILGKILTSFISKLISTIGLSLFDRLLGGIFGAFRGILVVVVLAALCALTDIPKSTEWQDALTRPAVETFVGILHGWLPEDWASQLLNATDIRKSK